MKNIKISKKRALIRMMKNKPKDYKEMKMKKLAHSRN